MAEKGLKLFYTQVFRDNFFHADMHPGNIRVDTTNPDDATYIALDFGIVGSLSPVDLYYIGENFLAIFNRDYRRVAELHVEAGWVPADTRIDEMEAAARTVCEPSFTRPLEEVSFAELLMDLFDVARRFKLTIQPQLIMLQKTLLNIEGMGRDLYPKINIWDVAKPELERIFRERGVVQKTQDLLAAYEEEAVRSLRFLKNATLKGLLRRVVGKIFPRQLIEGYCSEFETRNAASGEASAS